MPGFLLDTHVWWWAISEPHKLSRTASETIGNAGAEEIFIASISIWEFAMMASRKRISLRIDPAEWLKYALYQVGIRVIRLEERIALESCGLPGHFHKDPADRMIVATARIHHLTLLTKDQKILAYPDVTSVW